MIKHETESTVILRKFVPKLAQKVRVGNMDPMGWLYTYLHLYIIEM